MPPDPAAEPPAEPPVEPPAEPPAEPPVVDLGPALRAATQRLVRTVDALPEDDWSGWSLLPGWTRAHLLAHLALNAEALAGALEGAAIDEDVAMYASDAARDDAIEALAAEPPSVLRERLLGSTTRFVEASLQVAQLAAEDGPAVLRRRVEREPGGRTFLVGEAAEMRLREVEVHHADLDAGYTSAHWPASFPALLLDAMLARPATADVVADPDDDLRRWTFGAGGTVVTGPLHALAWWLTGRPADPALRTTDGAALPRVASW